MLLSTQAAAAAVAAPKRALSSEQSKSRNLFPSIADSSYPLTSRFTFFQNPKISRTTKPSLTRSAADGDVRPTSHVPSKEGNNDIKFVGDDDVPLEGVIQFDKPDASSSKLIEWAQVGILAGGDVLCLLIFAAVGRFTHGFPVFDLETLQTADPFIAGWFLSAYFLGAFGEDGKGINGTSKAIAATAKSWAVGIPLGILIRSGTSGHIPKIPFMLVTMGSTAVLLFGWRVLASKLLSKNSSKKNSVYKRGSAFELFDLLTSLVRRW